MNSSFMCATLAERPLGESASPQQIERLCASDCPSPCARSDGKPRTDGEHGLTALSRQRAAPLQAPRHARHRLAQRRRCAAGPRGKSVCVSKQARPLRLVMVSARRRARGRRRCAGLRAARAQQPRPGTSMGQGGVDAALKVVAQRALDLPARLQKVWPVSDLGVSLSWGGPAAQDKERWRKLAARLPLAPVRPPSPLRAPSPRAPQSPWTPGARLVAHARRGAEARVARGRDADGARQTSLTAVAKSKQRAWGRHAGRTRGAPRRPRAQVGHAGLHRWLQRGAARTS
jgi:hypothetical protein